VIRGKVTSNSFALPLTNITPLLLLLRNASYASLIASNPRKLWNSINTLLERKPSPLLPSLDSSQSLPQRFATFFSDKILKLHSALKYFTVSSTHISPNTLLPYLDLFLWSRKMKCLKSTLTHLTLSLIFDPIPRLSSNMPICTPTDLD